MYVENMKIQCIKNANKFLKKHQRKKNTNICIKSAKLTLVLLQSANKNFIPNLQVSMTK